MFYDVIVMSLKKFCKVSESFCLIKILFGEIINNLKKKPALHFSQGWFIWREFENGREERVDLVAKQEVVDDCDVTSCDFTVSVLVTIHHVAAVVVEQIVIEYCDVGTSYLAVAIHVACYE